MCVRMHECVGVGVCSQEFVLTVFFSLLWNGLCAPVWRNSS